MPKRKSSNTFLYTTAIVLILSFAVALGIGPFVLSEQLQQQNAIAQPSGGPIIPFINTNPSSTSSNTTTTGMPLTLSSSTNATGAPGSVLKLSRASIPIDIPLIKGYEDGGDIFFITTDASDKKIASLITNETGFKVNFAPLLTKSPDEAVAHFYIFKNGIKGKGVFGFQPNVADSQPGDVKYSPVWKVNTVEWKNGFPVQELKSEKQILDAKARGDLTVAPTDIYVNCPFVKWNGGSMKIRDDKNINDDSQYMGGQVLNIDTNKMVVTMIAHRGWGPDGKSIYYVVADATPQMPAAMMGVTLVPADEKFISSAAVVDLLQFKNGIKGSGPMGFQAGIGAANPTDSNYSPMWKISFMEWKDPSKARLLESLGDITAMQQAGMLTVMPAMGGKHVVNCPFFEPNTVFDHQSKTLATSTTT